jgi:hypothetical protein
VRGSQLGKDKSEALWKRKMAADLEVHTSSSSKAC